MKTTLTSKVATAAFVALLGVAAQAQTTHNPFAFEEGVNGKNSYGPDRTDKTTHPVSYKAGDFSPYGFQTVQEPKKAAFAQLDLAGFSANGFAQAN